MTTATTTRTPRATAGPTASTAEPDRVAREAVRQEARPTRTPDGRVIAYGRDGQPLTRAGSIQGGNQFSIPEGTIPPGWSWEWKNDTVLGQRDPAYEAELAQVGWMPVMAESFPGIFMPFDYKGPIRRKGMILMERPEELTLEARREEKRAADDKVRTSLRKHGKLDTTGAHGVNVDHRDLARTTGIKQEIIDGHTLPQRERMKIE